MPKPTIAAINGPAVGIGLSFALACDLSIAAESSYLMLAFVNIGLVPDGGSSFLIPERIGYARAIEMAMLGEKVPAPKALEWGLINRVVADDELQAHDRSARRPARRPARRAPTPAASASSTTGRSPACRSSSSWRPRSRHEMARTQDFVEGVTAFVEKRPPRFTGA